MTKAFWNAFGDDWRANCLSWERLGVVLPAQGDGWQSRWTANPDFLGDRVFYRGSGSAPSLPDELRDRLAVAEIVSAGPDGFSVRNARMIVDVGAPGEFDSADVLDPATVEFDGKILLYYSAIGDGPDSVGLAVSEDGGATFRKVGKVLVGRAPEVLVAEGKVMMLAQRLSRESYQLFLFESTDGESFQQVTEEPVFAPKPGSWDSLSVVTCRYLGEEDGLHTIFYGGSSDYADEPDLFGLARSKDLKTWERHPGNPVFGTGPKGAEDGGAMWFPAVRETPEGWLLLYEGSPGRYKWALNSQVCGAFRPKRGGG